MEDSQGRHFVTCQICKVDKYSGSGGSGTGLWYLRFVSKSEVAVMRNLRSEEFVNSEWIKQQAMISKQSHEICNLSHFIIINYWIRPFSYQNLQ